MTSLSHSTIRLRVVPGFGLTLAMLALLTLVRVIGLKFSVVDLFFDESQYWAWSRELAFGYFSKPPLLAWIIAAAERVCGASEACIRAPAPLFFFGTSLLVYAVARQLYDERIAFFSALTIALATGVSFSARIISTDVPLLFFWALALLAYVKLLTGGGPRWAIVLGVALGLGLLAKYAMIYFVLGAALAAWFDADARRLLRTPWPWLALAIAAVMVSPNVVWNVHNGLATFRHTGENIQGAGVAFSLLNGLAFLASQLGVFGPIAFVVLIGACARLFARSMPQADRLMLAFAIPPLVLVTCTAIVTRALANWAAPAFISGAVVVAAILVRRNAWKWLGLSLAIGVAAQVSLMVCDALAMRLHLPMLKRGDPYQRTMGWRALGELSGQLARRVGARAIVAEQRDDVSSLLYYWRDQPEQIFVWPRGPVPDHHFELTRPLTAAAPQPVLLVSRCPSAAPVAPHFAKVEALGSFAAPTGPTSSRTYYAFKLENPRGPIGPLATCP